MIIKKLETPEIKTATVTLEGVASRDTIVRGRPGEMIYIQTSDGTFSNVAQVWKDQGLDISSLNAGDVLKIHYVEKYYEKTGKYYRNFKRVVLVKASASRVNNIDKVNQAKSQSESSEWIDELFEEDGRKAS